MVSHPAGITVAVPFGPRPDWYTAAAPHRHTPAAAGRFTTALCREVTERASEFNDQTCATIHFGGCGPSLLSLDQLYRLLQTLCDCLRVEPVEQSLVVLPGTVPEGKAKVLRESGFDRAMLRLDGTLRGRDVAVLRESGLRTVGLETEYGTGDGWARQLDRLAELEPDHVTLHLPPGPTVSRAELLRGVRLARTRLAAGFRNYALHHFARPGHEWRHLLADLSGAPLAGFGPGALTRTAAHVRRNPSGFDDYLAGGTATAVPRGTAPDLMNELLSLRGIGLDSAAPDRVSPLLESGLLEKRGGRLLLTDQGALALDRVRLLLTGPGAQPVP